MQHSSSLPPFEGKYKIFIIDGAEQLSTEAANCLLKTLEEPADRMVYLLLTINEQLLPATVVSRCQRVELPPVAAGKLEAELSHRWGVEPQRASLLARLSHGSPGWALSAMQDDNRLQQHTERMNRILEVIDADLETRFGYASQLAARFSQNRTTVQEELDSWLDWWHDLLLAKVGNNNTITNNTCNWNNEGGIYICGSNNTISNNKVRGNSGHGIQLDGWSGNTISDNTCVDNFGPYLLPSSGIYISSSDNNMISALNQIVIKLLRLMG